MNTLLSRLLNNRTRVRNLFYSLIWVIMVLTNAYNPEQHQLRFDPFKVSFSLAFWLAAWVEHRFVLNPYLNSRRLGWAIVGSAGAIGCFIATRYLLEQQLYWYVLHIINYNPGTSLLYYANDNVYYAMPALGVGLAFKIMEDWLVHQQERAALVNEKTTAELAFLKSQVNPHFLFNTLNNIYALTYAKSDEAPGAILKLSELMRYMLYDSNGPGGAQQKVLLSKEVTYLENFVALEKLRVANAQVKLQVEGNTDLYRIEPLLLLPFVENAFKHGKLTDPGHPLVIDLSVRQGTLRFDTLNPKADRQKDAVGGIGLDNVRRRLALLYPNRHTLHITDEPDRYAVSLQLTL